MADKPDIGDSRWATDAGADKAAPSSGKRDIGFAEGDEPPASDFNVLHYAAYLWHLYLDEGELDGPIAISGLLTSRAVDETTYTPIYAGLDPSTGSRRAVVDHNGYRMGQICEWIEDWRTSGGTEPTGWSAVFGIGNGTSTYENPSSVMPYRHVALWSGDSGPPSAELTSPLIFYFSSDKTVVAEWDLRTGSTIDVGTSAEIFSGLQFNNGGSLNEEIYFQLKPDTSGFVQCVTKDSGGIVDTGTTAVSVAVDTTYRLRIEIVGADNHAGSNSLARFFVNGALAHSFNFSTIGPDSARMRHRVLNSGSHAAPSYTIYIGPHRVCWNHRGSPDAL